MPNNTSPRQTIVVASTCLVYLFLTIFYHHIDKYTTGLLFIVLTLLIPITLVAMVVYAIKGIIQLIKHRKEVTINRWLPTAVALVTLSYTFLSPYRLDSERLESKVVLRACYEGTQNQAYILFRADSTFEMNFTGIVADKWYYGTYNRNADSLFLRYRTKQPLHFGDTLTIKGDNLLTTKKDTSKFYIPFYLGYCKGLN